MAKQTANYQWLDSKLVIPEDAAVPVGRGLWYGDGCFESLLVEEGAAFGMEYHLDRLQQGMEYLRFSGYNPVTEQIREGIRELLRANNLENTAARVRIQVWREGAPGFAPPEKQRIRLHITASEIDLQTPPITLVTVPTRRIPHASVRSDLKLSSAVNYIAAAAEARERGAAEALMLTNEGMVSETTIANIFWLSGETIYTPSSECDLLPGIMRACFMEWLRNEQHQWKLKTGKFPPEALQQAEAAWLTNSVRIMQPIARWDDQNFEESLSKIGQIKQDFRWFLHKNYKLI